MRLFDIRGWFRRFRRDRADQSSESTSESETLSDNSEPHGMPESSIRKYDSNGKPATLVGKSKSLAKPRSIVEMSGAIQGSDNDWEAYNSTAGSSLTGPAQGSGERFGPEAKLDGMPVEILIMISHLLPDASRMTFALACRSIYQVHFDADNHPPLTTRKDREEFLQLLERDIANLYFCQECTVLHPWSAEWGISGRSPLSYQPLHKWHRYGIPLQGNEKLMCQSARLFLNRHLYGPAHGLPLSKLEERWDATSLSGVRLQGARRGRIIDNELFVLITYAFDSPRGKGGNLRRFMEQSGISICNHVHATDDSSNLYDWKAMSLQRPSLDIPLVPCQTTTESCPMCLTDYSVKITRLENGQGWTVTIDVFKQLGHCRSHFDWKWRAASERGVSNEPRSINHPAGMVRDRWAAAEGRKGDEAKFVGQPKDMEYFIPGTRRCPWDGHCIRGYVKHDCATYGLDD